MKSNQPYLYLLLGFISSITVSGIVELGAFGRYCGIIMRLWSLYHLYLIIKFGCIKGPMRYFTLFVLLLIAYSVIPAIQGRTYGSDLFDGFATMTAFNYINLSWMYACPVFSFYWFTRKGLIDKDFIRFLTIAGIVYCCFLFIHISTSYAQKYGAGVAHVNNTAYVFLHLFPLLFYFKGKSRLQFIILFILIVAIFMGAKRGAILIALICLTVFFKGSIKIATKNRSTLIFFSIVTLIIVAFIFGYMYTNNAYFNERITSVFEGDSSQRDVLYQALWNSYNDVFSLNEKLFGRGINAPLVLTGMYAHNDWLEYLMSFGVFGCGIYVIYFTSLFRFYWKYRHVNIEQTKSFLLTIIILFMTTLFSMSYTGMTIFIGFSLAYSVCYLEQYSRTKIKK